MPDLDPEPQYAHRGKVLVSVLILAIFGIAFLIKGALF